VKIGESIIQGYSGQKSQMLSPQMSQAWKLMLLVPAMQEMEVRSQSKASPRQKKSMRPYLKNKLKAKRAKCMTGVIECPEFKPHCLPPSKRKDFRLQAVFNLPQFDLKFFNCTMVKK
jgi:hypothetical protein